MRTSSSNVVKWIVIGLEDLCVSNFLASNDPVVAEGSVDLELQHGEEEVLKEYVQPSVPRTWPGL